MSRIGRCLFVVAALAATGVGDLAAQRVGYRATLGRQSLGDPLDTPYLGAAEASARAPYLGDYLKEGWQSTFMMLFNRVRNPPVYVGVGFQWTTFELRNDTMPEPLPELWDSLPTRNQIVQAWNTASTEVVVGAKLPFNGVYFFAETGLLWTRFRSQSQLLWKIKNPPSRRERPYDEWSALGRQVSIGALFPVIEPSPPPGGQPRRDESRPNRLDLEVGFRGSDYGDVTLRFPAHFRMPDLRVGPTWTIYAGLRWNA
jgi:hypothetical protein